MNKFYDLLISLRIACPEAGYPASEAKYMSIEEFLTKRKAVWYVVYLCGCTDCFPHAAFLDKNHAHKWAQDNNTNPEGYLIQEKHWKEINLDACGC
jgi:hypothetical protein